MFRDPEAVIQDADIEQAELEAAGNRAARGIRRMRALRAAGNLDGAAAACPHGGGYPLDSPAAWASGDPFAGQAGVRCADCGSRLNAFRWDGGRVLVPCEIAGR